MGTCAAIPDALLNARWVAAFCLNTTLNYLAPLLRSDIAISLLAVTFKDLCELIATTKEPRLTKRTAELETIASAMLDKFRSPEEFHETVRSLGLVR